MGRDGLVVGGGGGGKILYYIMHVFTSHNS